MTVQVRQAAGGMQTDAWLAGAQARCTGAENALLARAAEMANAQFGERLMPTGESYLNHAREVAGILVGMSMDAESIAAGLLAALPSIRADAVAYLRDNLSAGASRTDVQQSNGTMRIKLNGRFDFSAHRAFRDAYSPGIDATDVRQIDIDLAQVDYLDSSALGMLLMLREKAQAASKGIKLTNCKGSVRQVLDIANFSKLFEMG